ncbi:MAG: S53 family peptidase [Candidatus Bathyarchaeota archaeon]|nr:S53 family peptidase [Candidatus Bathyarchaeota archaeon]
MALMICLAFTVSILAPYTQASAQPSNNWVVHPLHTALFTGYTTPHGYTPTQMRTAYNLPDAGGAGKIIAIITAYDNPYILNAFNTFSHTYNLPDNSSGGLLVHKMPGITPADESWSLETCLDVEWAHAIAPNATILLVEAKDNQGASMFDAITYATNQQGVVAVSMSWGGEEESNQLLWDQYFNKAGIEFFAASGDNSEDVIYPASSRYVVAVGGTTLNLQADGTVISEVAWDDSGGGTSKYEPLPSYQANYGLTYSKRAVPDVSYNADPATGIPVYYNGYWYKVGGTSAGAPQWAAIHALGASATNNELYQKAQIDYAAYFRDITEGANANYSATIGYDRVTGLGSPLTYNFGTYLEVSPTEGAGQTPIALTGRGFLGSSINLYYLNPQSNTWISIANNTATTNGNFTLQINAPDLLQNNLAGDHKPASDYIVFRARDSNDGRYYNSTEPYALLRRGLTQVNNVFASGVFGNRTDLTTQVFTQKGQSLLVSGMWFNPGIISLLWDNQTLWSSIADDLGTFTASVQVPTTTVGKHIIVIRDQNSDFSFNITREPFISLNYNGGWYTSDFTLDLTPDAEVTELFYCINGGVIQNVTANGSPVISTEGENGTLEYWSSWNPYGVNLETAHTTLGSIKLDKTPPSGTITTNTVTSSSTITLNVTATDATSGITNMRFSNDNQTYTNWETYTTSKNWTLQSGDGTKTVYAEFQDAAGLTSQATCTVTLESNQPAQTAQPTSPPAASASTTQSTTKPTVTASPTATPAPTPAIPELNLTIIIAMLTLTAVGLIIKRKK